MVICQFQAWNHYVQTGVGVPLRIILSALTGIEHTPQFNAADYGKTTASASSDQTNCKWQAVLARCLAGENGLPGGLAQLGRFIALESLLPEDILTISGGGAKYRRWHKALMANRLRTIVQIISMLVILHFLTLIPLPSVATYSTVRRNWENNLQRCSICVGLMANWDFCFSTHLLSSG